MQSFGKIARWIAFFFVIIAYGLSVWELLDLQLRLQKTFDGVIENILNSIVFFTFIILVIIFSISFLRLQIKRIFRFHFLGDDNFYYDFCKKIKIKTFFSFNLILGIFTFIFGIVLILISYFSLRDLDSLQRKPVMHYWLIYLIVIYCWINIQSSCTIKIKNLDDISKSKFS